MLQRSFLLFALLAANALAGPDRDNSFERWNRLGIRAFREARREQQ